MKIWLETHSVKSPSADRSDDQQPTETKLAEPLKQNGARPIKGDWVPVVRVNKSFRRSAVGGACHNACDQASVGDFGAIGS